MSLREAGNSRGPHTSTGGDHESAADAPPEVLRELLDRYVTQQLVTAKLSRLALRASFDEVLDAAAASLREGLEADSARVLELVSGEVTFCMRAGVGWPDNSDDDHCEPADPSTIEGHALRHNEAVIVEDFAGDQGFEPSPLLERQHIRSAIATRIPSHKRPFGVISAQSRTAGQFSEADVEFVRTIANIVGESAHRDHSEQQRRRMYEELHRAMSSREEMLAIISHDLRSPASAIKLSLEIVRRAVTDPTKALPPEQVERAIRKASSNVDRMMTMMDDLLAMSRAESDAFEIEWEDVDLREIVDEMVTDYQRALETSGSQITVDGPEVLMGHWDWMRIQQVVSNLLSNAIKYGQGNPITIALGTDQDHAELRIRDQGRGIPKQQQSRIFERFVRIDHRDHDAMNDSYGLGLWIVARIVDALHGHVSVESEPGEGSTFIVRLPLE